jgi:putative endonuclease
MKSKTLGNIGESLSYKYLKEQGYTQIKHNVSKKIGEIDIVAQDKDKTLVFIEVKTRSSLQFGYPKEAVDYHKQQKIRLTASAYLKSKGLIDIVSVRFDVIEIFGDNQDYQLNHIKDAF